MLWKRRCNGATVRRRRDRKYLLHMARKSPPRRYCKVMQEQARMARPKLPSPISHCRFQTTALHCPIPVYPGVYQSALEIRQSQHPCGLQPAFGEQVQNLE